MTIEFRFIDRVPHIPTQNTGKVHVYINTSPMRLNEYVEGRSLPRNIQGAYLIYLTTSTCSDS